MPKFVFDAVQWMEQNSPPTIGAAPDQPEPDEFVFDAEEWFKTKDLPAPVPQYRPVDPLEAVKNIFTQDIPEALVGGGEFLIEKGREFSDQTFGREPLPFPGATEDLRPEDFEIRRRANLKKLISGFAQKKLGFTEATSETFGEVIPEGLRLGTRIPGALAGYGSSFLAGLINPEVVGGKGATRTGLLKEGVIDEFLPTAGSGLSYILGKAVGVEDPSTSSILRLGSTEEDYKARVNQAFTNPEDMALLLEMAKVTGKAVPKVAEAAVRGTFKGTAKLADVYRLSPEETLIIDEMGSKLQRDMVNKFREAQPTQQLTPNVINEISTFVDKQKVDFAKRATAEKFRISTEEALGRFKGEPALRAETPEITAETPKLLPERIADEAPQFTFDPVSSTLTPVEAKIRPSGKAPEQPLATEGKADIVSRETTAKAEKPVKGKVAEPVKKVAPQPEIKAEKVKKQPKQLHEMTTVEFERHTAPAGFGDFFTTPDGKFGKMRGSGGLGSDRVKLFDVNDKFIGHYSRNELKVVRKTGVQHTAERIADKHLESISSKISNLKKENQSLLSQKGLYDRFQKGVRDKDITESQFKEKQKDGTIMSDVDFKKALDIERQINEVRETPLPNIVNQAHKTIVEQAIADGKTIPPEVLKDFPDLKSDGKAKVPTPPVKPLAEPSKIAQKVGGLKYDGVFPSDADAKLVKTPQTFQFTLTEKGKETTINIPKTEFTEEVLRKRRDEKLAQFKKPTDKKRITKRTVEIKEYNPPLIPEKMVTVESNSKNYTVTKLGVERLDMLHDMFSAGGGEKVSGKLVRETRSGRKIWSRTKQLNYYPFWADEVFNYKAMATATKKMKEGRKLTPLQFKRIAKAHELLREYEIETFNRLKETPESRLEDTKKFLNDFDYDPNDILPFAVALSVAALADDDNLELAGAVFIGGSKAFKKAKKNVKKAMLSKKPRSKFVVSKVINEFLRAFSDELDPIRRYVRDVETKAGVTLRGEANPHTLATALKGNVAGKAQQWIHRFTTDFDGLKTGESLKTVMNSVKGFEDDALEYAYSLHAIERWAQEKDPGINLEDAQAIVQHYNAINPRYEQFAKDLTAYRRRLLDYVVDAGGISKELAALFREMYEYAVPLYRLLDDSPLGSGQGSKYANLATPVKRAKKTKGREGITKGDAPVANILGNLMFETYRMLSFADKVRVQKSLVEAGKLIDGMEPWVEEIQLDVKPKLKRQVKDVIAELKRAVGAEIDIKTDDPKVFDEFMTFWGQSKVNLPENVVTFWVDGEQKAFKIDPDLYKSIASIDPKMYPAIMKILSIPKKMQVLGATALRAPFGLVTNPLRDPFTYTLRAQNWTATPFDPLLKGTVGVMKHFIYDKIPFLAKTIGETKGFREDPAMKKWNELGNEMVSMINAEVPKAMENADKLLRGPKVLTLKEWRKNPAKNLKRSGIITIESTFDLYRDIINLPEQSPRKVEFSRVYKKVLKETGDERTAWIEASVASKDATLNFTRSGYIGRFLNQMIPFINANLQDYSLVYRSFKQVPLKTFVKGIAWLTLPTLLLWWQNKDEDWYQALPEYRRILAWNFKTPFTGDWIVSFPRPFMFGMMFAAIPEVMANYAYTKDKKQATEAFEQMFESVVPDLTPAIAEWIPSLSEVGQGETGYDRFLDRHIVSPFVVGATTPEERTSRYTTNTADWIGQLLGVAPKKVDHWIRSVTGGMGEDLVRFLEPKKIKADSPRDIPFYNRIVKPPPWTDFVYRRLNEDKNDFNRIKGLKKKGERISEDESNLFDNYEAFKDAAKKMTEFRKAIIGIERDKTIPFNVKEPWIIQLDRESEELAKRAVFDYFQRRKWLQSNKEENSK